MTKNPNILKPKKTRNDDSVLLNTAFIGTNVSLNEVSFIALLSLAYGSSKTKFIRTIFAEWYAHEYSKDKVKDAIVKVSDDVFLAYKTEGVRKFTGSRKSTFDDFIEVLKKELIGKGLSQKYANIIEVRLRKLHEEDSKNKASRLVQPS